MRRFELVEGSSSKFWEIALAGTSFDVTFGKIGTRGQSQTKTFASAEKAQSEHDKLVKEKLKKGYVEVGAAKSSKAAKPLPATRAAAAKDLPAVVASTSKAPKAPLPVSASRPSAGIPWTELDLECIAPRLCDSLVPPRPINGARAYARIRKCIAVGRDNIITTASSNAAPPAAKAFEDAVVPTSLDAEVQAKAYASFAELTYGPWEKSEGIDADFVDYWCAVAGVEFAMRALVEGRTAVGKECAGFVMYGDFRRRADWRSLRNAVLLAGAAARPALEAVAKELYASHGVLSRVPIVCAFERAEWARADLETLLAAPSFPPRAYPLLLCLPPDEVRSFTDRMRIDGAEGVGPIRFDLVEHVGASIAPVLLAAMEEDPDAELAKALAHLATPEVVQWFVDNLSMKGLQGMPVTYFAAVGAVAVEPLAKAASGKGAHAEKAKTALRGLLTARPELAAKGKGSASPAARTLAESSSSVAAPRAEASAAEVPRVLRELPWRSPPRAAAKVVLRLALLPLAERVDLKPGEMGSQETWEGSAKTRKDALRRIKEANAGPRAARPFDRERLSVFSLLLLEEAAAAFNSAKLENYYDDDAVESLIAHCGTAIVPGLVVYARLQRDEPRTLEIMARVGAPAIAPMMAEALATKRGRAVATTWFETYTEIAVTGLVPPVVGPEGVARTQAENALRLLTHKGHRALVDKVAARYGKDASTAIGTLLDADPLLVLPKKIPTLPSFFRPASLSRPLLADRKKSLSLEHLEAVGTMLAFTDFAVPYQGLVQIKEATDPKSLAAFAWDLFQAWLSADAPSKDAWAFQALGLFGDDECARNLAALLRVWPGESAHARAVLGLDVLAAIGSDVALMHLHAIAQKLKFKGLQDKAREKIDQIAEARGLSADELADRLVPDLGLEDDGTLTLDFGKRHFKVVFDETLKPAVIDDSGKRLPDLPKARSTDDGDKAREAVDTWKTLKKDAKTIATGQLLRLETAMCTQRRWNEDVFRTFFVGHPLIVHVARRLVWGTYDASGALVATFRVAEDATLADAKDAVYTPSANAPIGIVHRLEMPDAVARAWGQILGDYEVLQPFEQLSRFVARLDAKQKKSNALATVDGLQVPAKKVLSLDARGWRRGSPGDGGVINVYTKPLPGAVAVLALEPGLAVMEIDMLGDQTLGTVVVRKGDDAYGDDGVALGTLSPIVVSELMRDLESLHV